MIALVGSFFLAIVLGIPISVAIGVASVFYLVLYGSVSLAVIAQQMTIGIDSFPLLAIPLFLLAGLLMSEANITERIIGFDWHWFKSGGRMVFRPHIDLPKLGWKHWPWGK